VPRNIVKQWGLYPKIIDFGISDTEHVCPGWNECGELQVAWRELLLDSLRVTSLFRRWMPGWFGLREAGSMNYCPALLFTVGVILLVSISIFVVIPTN
jgi:hypothetical protein